MNFFRALAKDQGQHIFTLQQLNNSSYTECLGVSHRLLRMYQIRTTTEPSPMSARGTHPHRNPRH